MQHYLHFVDYHEDGGDKVVALSDEEFALLLPHVEDLCEGNVVPEVDKLIWEEYYNRPDCDLRPSELRQAEDAELVIEFAIV